MQISFLSWDTRIRTWNDRTRICSVTITPYPNFPDQTLILFLTLQRYGFLLNWQTFEIFFSKKISTFSKKTIAKLFPSFSSDQAM